MKVVMDNARLMQRCVWQEGISWHVSFFDGTTREVTPFTDAYESMKDILIVMAATAWTNKETGETLILLFHQEVLLTVQKEVGEQFMESEPAMISWFIRFR
jgi:hypothetical protein